MEPLPYRFFTRFSSRTAALTLCQRRCGLLPDAGRVRVGHCHFEMTIWLRLAPLMDSNFLRLQLAKLRLQ